MLLHNRALEHSQGLHSTFVMMMIHNILTGTDFCIKQETRSNMTIYKFVERVEQKLAHFSLNKHPPNTVFIIFTSWYSRFPNLEYHVIWQVVIKRSAPSGLLCICVISHDSTDLMHLIYNAAESLTIHTWLESSWRVFCSSLQIMWLHNQKDQTIYLSNCTPPPHHTPKHIMSI